MTKKTAVVCGRLSTLPDLTDLQDVFNYVVYHIRKQRFPAVDRHSNDCAYRARLDPANDSSNPTDTGCCAAGSLIPDDNYSPNLEGVNVGSVTVVSAIFGKNFEDNMAEFGPTINMLQGLQMVHDQMDAEKGFDGKVDGGKLQVLAACLGLKSNYVVCKLETLKNPGALF